MKDDLISRKALIDDLCQDRKEGTFDFTEKQAEAAVKIVRYVNGRIEAQPSVPAVPLDKLCEMFAKNADCPPEHSPVQDHCNQAKCAECWKSVLKEWMEEQNA